MKKYKQDNFLKEKKKTLKALKRNTWQTTMCNNSWASRQYAGVATNRLRDCTYDKRYSRSNGTTLAWKLLLHQTPRKILDHLGQSVLLISTRILPAIAMIADVLRTIDARPTLTSEE